MVMEYDPIPAVPYLLDVAPEYYMAMCKIENCLQTTGLLATIFLFTVAPAALADSVITSVTESVIVPSTIIVGTGFIFAENHLPPQFFDQPSIPPTFSGTGKSDVFASYNSGLTSPVVNGDEVSNRRPGLAFRFGRLHQWLYRNTWLQLG